MYSYCDIEGERLILEDIYSGNDSRGNKVQFVRLKYKNKVYNEKLRVNIRDGIDIDKIPYILFNDRVIYLEDMTDVYS